jgi:adenylylsulfate kinase
LIIQAGKRNKEKETMNRKPFVLWFTGLPKSGKTEIAEIVQILLQQHSIQVELIDSGKIRSTPLGATLGFSKADRETNVRRHAVAANLLLKNGVLPIVSAISPYREIRDSIRKELPNYIEIFVNTPKDFCISRDTSGTWQKAIRGEITNFTGVSDPYQEPLDPEITLSIVENSAVLCAQIVVNYLFENTYIEKDAPPPDSKDLLHSLSKLGYLEE